MKRTYLLSSYFVGVNQIATRLSCVLPAAACWDTTGCETLGLFILLLAPSK